MTAPARVRVLVVDDSAFARKVIREVLATSSRVDVVGTARDGLEALEQIATLQPDVVTLDLVMPNLDGVGVLKELGEQGPRVVVVSMSDEESEVAVEALASGAFDFVRKPTSLATERLYELRDELLDKVLAAAAAGRRPRDAIASQPAAAAPQDASLIVVGTSTGGPQALTRLMPALPADLPPIVIALHIPAEYTGPMAKRLDGISTLHVVEARPSMRLERGVAVLARGGSDLEVERRDDGYVARVVHRPARTYHPSVDALFESAALAGGASVMGVVLTGMGNDGLSGARAIRGAGGWMLVESPESCVVDGMPRSIREAALANASVPLDQIASEIARQAKR